MSSVLPSLSVYPRQRKIYLFLALLFASTLIQLWPLYHLQPLRVILRVGACNMLIILSLTAFYRLLVGKILALGGSLLLTVNFMIALCTWEIYQSDFNIVFAMSILETHWAEVKSMTGMYISWMPVCVIYFLLTYFSIHNGAKCLSSKIQRAAMVILLIFLAWFTYSQWKKQQKDGLGGYYPLSARALKVTPFYVASNFIVAYRDIAFAKELKQIDIDLPGLTTKDTDIDTYVIIIGESARRSNMSLYGFEQNTTPVQNTIAPQALIFDNAISPAAATVTSIPMILSKASTESFTAADLSNNIVTLANKAGFQTTWLSTQNVVGKHNNYITLIGSASNKSQWMTGEYDDALLPHLDEALKEKGKKLIMLHINGSHEIACTRYPEWADKFKTGNKYEDCYNNSILFTDYVIGEVIKRLEGSKSSLLYFSDHGLEKNPDIPSLYMHGADTPSKEAYDVPQFIWYSSEALNSQSRKLGHIRENYSLLNNYAMMLDWLGISTGETRCNSPLSECYRPATSIPVTDGSRAKVFEYKDLRDTFASPKKKIPYREASPNPL
ncbi:phosphoethanolamine transferase [Escherichia fergusonii]|uniref:phosphoethanolamine transferase n=1 Tax=Escherichia fergusonii TaxID=564 RepID=UPI0015F4A8CD|nr:phosphoethanolamine transferase [Escherichia fergusonii]MBA5614116.1 phosphoethanolamine transferase [Escherichia fergusonii]MBA5663569.1 phosphoethanolamine transferase [Escherichia fergusonii]MBA8157690.1 phosphoethanolamine transferase [Escherichia fergusonii]MBA8169759.1 phosphoethanolamine transferase [Escherichia fergusonii]MBA8184145.1 phosphoethanolamine transferase [Escherichia fergusonii]